MFRRLVPVLFLVGAVGISDANAMAISVDSVAQTIARPASGFVDVLFTGTITLDPGFEQAGAFLTVLLTAGGDLIDSSFPTVTNNLTGTLFSVRVASTDGLGLYAFQADLVHPALINFFECQIGGGACNTATVNYSVNVVPAAPVPEPASLLLVGSGIAAVMAQVRNRRKAQRAS